MDKNKKNLIYNVATDIREKSEAYAKKHRLDSSLCGLCASASMALYHVLKHEHGMNDVMLKKTSTHCWIECDGTIIDITATQFGFPKKIFFEEKDNIFFHYNYKNGKPTDENDIEWDKWNGYGPQDVRLFENILGMNKPKNS